MPRSYGDTLVHSSHFDWAVRYDCPLPCITCPPPNGLEQEIGKIIAQRLIEDGATLQLGIGCIPDAVLSGLVHHKDLGIHSEIICDAMVDLVHHGNITNKCKTKHRGRIVSSFAIGTKKLYDFLHSNPVIGNYDRLVYVGGFGKGQLVILQLHSSTTLEMLGIDYVNDPRVISLQPKMTAINSCIEMDLTGQVCSDSLGCKVYAGTGGHMDFLRGAAISKDGHGKAIIAFPSVTSQGESKIQPVLKLGMKGRLNSANKCCEINLFIIQLLYLSIYQ